MDKSITKEQIGRIISLLVADHVSFDEAEEFIERYSKKPEKENPPQSADPHLAFWEEKFPGKGEAIMDVLRPFYGWKPELKPALLDLEERGKHIIHLRTGKGVRISKVSKTLSCEDAFQDRLKTAREAMDEHETTVWVRNAFRYPFRDPLEDLPFDPLEDPRRYLLETSLMTSLLGSLQDSLSNSLRDPFLDTGLLLNGVNAALRYTLLFVSGFALADRPGLIAMYKPLLELWLAGNFPILFERDEILFVLVA